MLRLAAAFGLGVMALSVLATPVGACPCNGDAGGSPDWQQIAFRGGWQGYGGQDWGHGGEDFGPEFSGPIGPDPAGALVQPAVPPPPAWRILAGHADGFEYLMLTDPEEHPRATLLKVQAPAHARVYLDNRELKQGFDGLWRYAPKEPLLLHRPNVHTVRAVVDHSGQQLERTVTFRLAPGKLLKIRFE